MGTGFSVVCEPFGTAPGGDRVDLYTLTNDRGVAVRIATYGGIVVSVVVPDAAGRMADVVLGHDSIEGYLRASPYFGAIVGRYANRISGARFTLDGTTYRLAANQGRHHLHGGLRGFDKVVWSAEPFRAGDGCGVALGHTSPDGDEGYPGRLVVRVTYTLTGRDELAVDYRATADRPTPLNLTQHSYFNLAGGGDVLDHVLQVDSDSITEVDEALIPTGALVPVQGGPFDFRSPTAIGARIESDDDQLRRGGGYDHNFVLNRAGPGLVHAARLVDPGSGRRLDVRTTEPGMQLYTGNGLDGAAPGKGGRVYGSHAGLCLETQHYPDSPNQPGFPSTILRPGEEYVSRTVYGFGLVE